MRIPNWTGTAAIWGQTLTGSLSNIHRPGERPDIFIFATPRSGPMFLEELLFAQPGAKIHDEPLTVNYPASRRELGVTNWEELAILPDREQCYFRFFDRLRRNRVKALNTPIYRPHGRLLTNRNVFKVIHGAEGMIPWFAETFGTMVVILLRHPIPTALSHAQLPRLPYFLKQSALRRLLSASEIAFTEKLIADGDKFERSVLNWALQVLAMLRPGIAPGWAVVSYEDLTVYPRQSFDHLRAKLDLEPVIDIEALAAQPSQSTYKVTLNDEFLRAARGGDRTYFIRRWVDRVSGEQIRRCFEICHAFGLDVYEEGNLFPTSPYRIPRPPLAATDGPDAVGMAPARSAPSA